MKKRRPRSLAAALAAFGGKGSAQEPAEDSADPRELPFPPLEYRQIVGPTDKAVFDNPSGDPVWGDLAIGPLAPREAWEYFLTLVAELDLKIVGANWTTKPGYQTELFLAVGDDFEDLSSVLEPPSTVLGFGPSAPPPHDGPE